MNYILLFVFCSVNAFQTELTSSKANEEAITLNVGDSKEVLFYSNTKYIIDFVGLSNFTSAIQLLAVSETHQVSLSLDINFAKQESANGTTIGIFASCHQSTLSQGCEHVYAELLFHCNCCSDFSEYVLLTSSEILTTQPLPGGCNLVHSLDVYPNLDVSISQNRMTKIFFSAANAGYYLNQSKPICDGKLAKYNHLKYDVYVYFSANQHTYVENSLGCCNGIHNNSCRTPSLQSKCFQEITAIFSNHSNHHRKIATLSISDKTQYYLSAYQCAGLVTYIVVRDPAMKTSSIYIPAIINSQPQRILSNVFFQVICVLMALLGLCLCFVGHRFFTFELFGCSTLFFMLVAYYLVEICASETLNDYKKLGIIIGVGVAGGFIIAIMWWRFGFAELFSLFVGFIGGFLFSSIVFMTPLTNLSFFRKRLMYVVSFFCIDLLYVLICFAIIKPHIMCIVTSSFLGSFLVVASVGAGSIPSSCSITGQFVPFVIKKMFGENYAGNAFYVFPLYIVDKVLIGVWCILFAGGLITQLSLQRNRPKFPLSSYQLKRQRALSPPPRPLAINDDSASVGTGASSDVSRGSSFTSTNYDGDISGHEEQDDSVQLLRSQA